MLNSEIQDLGSWQIMVAQIYNMCNCIIREKRFVFYKSQLKH